MTEKENRRSRLTRRLLREALMELLKEKNISQISIKSICEKADMNRTTFYLHYQDQYALFDELINDVYNGTVEYMNDVKATGKIEYVQAFLEYVKANGETFKTFLVSNPSAGLRDKLLKLTFDNMTEMLPELPDKDETVYIRNFVAEGGFSSLVAWVAGDFTIPVEKMAELSWRIPSYIHLGASADAAKRKAE